MGLIDTIKDVVTLVQKADNIELVKQVLALQSQAQDMIEENRGLREKVATLEATLNLAKNLTFKAPFYFAEGDTVPLCPRCWEIDRRSVHLQGPFRVTGLRWDCPQCDKTYRVQTEEERNRGPVRPPRRHL
jgi:hypothetical protein